MPRRKTYKCTSLSSWKIQSKGKFILVPKILKFNQMQDLQKLLEMHIRKQELYLFISTFWHPNKLIFSSISDQFARATCCFHVIFLTFAHFLSFPWLYNFNPSFNPILMYLVSFFLLFKTEHVYMVDALTRCALF